MGQDYQHDKRMFGVQTSSQVQITFTTGRDGIAAVLGPLETQIMCALWEREIAVSIRTLRREDTAFGGLAASTIQTTLHRLVEKGWVERYEDSSQRWSSHNYRPRFDESMFRLYVIRALLKDLPSFGQGIIDERRRAEMFSTVLDTVREMAAAADIELEIDISARLR